MAILCGLGVVSGEPVLLRGTKKERVIEVTLLGDAATTSVNLTDATSGANVNQYGIGTIERIQVCERPYNGTTKAPPVLNTWVDASAIPAIAYFTAAPTNTALTIFRIRLVGTG